MAEKKLKFLSTGTIVGKGKDIAKKMDKDQSKKLYRVWGLAVSVRTRENKYGTQPEFRGQFQCVNLETGAVSTGGRLYLPGEAADELESTLKSDTNNKGIKFGYEVGITADDSDRGYFYTVQSFLEAQQSDVLNELAKLAGVKVENKPAPAPKTEGRPAPRK